MKRYLMNISYIGTNFRGMQKTLPEDNNRTVQGAIEKALKVFKPINDIELHLSSRTDAGVHALHSTVHVDLDGGNNRIIPANSITSALNHIFQVQNLPIHILNTENVPPTFHCRQSVKERKYMYRLAVAKEFYKPVDDGKKRKRKHRSLLHIGSNEIESIRKASHRKFKPIEELDRCLFIFAEQFDIEKAKDASKLLIGRHDFRTFMGSTGEYEAKHPFFAVRKIRDITITPDTPLATHFNYNRCVNDYNYWKIEVTGTSFVNRQVRRMVTVLINVATGQLTNRDVYEMLTIPSKHSWKGNGMASAGGLYLAHVLYHDGVKDFPDSDAESQVD